MAICNHDHDQLAITFDPAMARELGCDWNERRPTTINLATASKAELIHLAAACISAAGDYLEGDQHMCCGRLIHAAQDAVAQMTPRLIDAFDKGSQYAADPVIYFGDAVRGGWRQ